MNLCTWVDFEWPYEVHAYCFEGQWNGQGWHQLLGGGVLTLRVLLAEIAHFCLHAWPGEAVSQFYEGVADPR